MLRKTPIGFGSSNDRHRGLDTECVSPIRPLEADAAAAERTLGAATDAGFRRTCDERRAQHGVARCLANGWEERNTERAAVALDSMAQRRRAEGLLARHAPTVKARLAGPNGAAARVA
jgi:hypothetical protein